MRIEKIEAVKILLACSFKANGYGANKYRHVDSLPRDGSIDLGEDIDLVRLVTEILGLTAAVISRKKYKEAREVLKHDIDQYFKTLGGKNEKS